MFILESPKNYQAENVPTRGGITSARSRRRAGRYARADVASTIGRLRNRGNESPAGNIELCGCPYSG